MKGNASWRTLFGFLAVTIGGGVLIGVLTIPGDWYAALNKPPLTPPNWIFAPAWTFLYLLVGIAGARVSASPHVKLLLPIWTVQLVLNFAWSPVVFSFHDLRLGLLIIVLLLFSILGFILLANRRERVSAFLFAPYALWVAFATYLNGSLVLVN